MDEAVKTSQHEVCICCGERSGRIVIHHDHFIELNQLARLLSVQIPDSLLSARFADVSICEKCNSYESARKLQLISSSNPMRYYFSFSERDVQNHRSGSATDQDLLAIFSEEGDRIVRAAAWILEAAEGLSHGIQPSETVAEQSIERARKLLSGGSRGNIENALSRKGKSKRQSLSRYEATVVRLSIKSLDLKIERCPLCQRELEECFFLKQVGRDKRFSTTGYYDRTGKSVVACSDCDITLKKNFETDFKEAIVTPRCALREIARLAEVLDFPIVEYGATEVLINEKYVREGIESANVRLAKDDQLCSQKSGANYVHEFTLPEALKFSRETAHRRSRSHSDSLVSLILGSKRDFTPAPLDDVIATDTPEM